MNTDKRRAWFVELQRLLVAVNSGGVGVSSSDIVGWFRRGQQEWAEAAILALRDTADLRTENARLRGEIEAYKRAKAENDERFMIERDVARADLARVTAERDALLLALRASINAADMVRAAIAACAPPASGEEG
jgi:hypothetical protein